MDVKNWLKSEHFFPIQQGLRDKLNHNDEVRVIIETEDNLLRKLPGINGICLRATVKQE